MNETMAPDAAAATPANDLNFFARWANIYFAPRKTFEAVKVRPAWIWPVLLISLIGIGLYWWTAPIRYQDQMAKMKKNERIAALPAEQQQAIFERMEGQFKSPLSLAIGFAISLAYFFALAGILFFLGNVVMGGEARYPQLLGMFAYTAFIGVPEGVVVGFLANAKGTLDTALSLAAFFPASMQESFVYRLINGFDIFSIWTISVLIVGLATVYNFKPGKVATWLIPLWVLWKVAAAALAGLGMMFGG